MTVFAKFGAELPLMTRILIGTSSFTTHYWPLILAAAGAAFFGFRAWIATPNLNFLVAVLTDPAFRDSVLRSDLSIADGMPIIWIARLLRIPLYERVAGSTLFERQTEHGVHFAVEIGARDRECRVIHCHVSTSPIPLDG